MEREEMIRLLVGVQEGLPGAGRRWATLENVIRALESEEVVAEGWAGPERLRSRWDFDLGQIVYHRHIPVHLDRAPKDSRRVRILAVKEGEE